MMYVIAEEQSEFTYTPPAQRRKRSQLIRRTHKEKRKKLMADIMMLLGGRRASPRTCANPAFPWMPPSIDLGLTMNTEGVRGEDEAIIVEIDAELDVDAEEYR